VRKNFTVNEESREDGNKKKGSSCDVDEGTKKVSFSMPINIFNSIYEYIYKYG